MASESPWAISGIKHHYNLSTRIGLIIFKRCITIAVAKLPGSIITFLYLTFAHFDSYCILISHNHDWSPPVLLLWHCTYAPACHQIPLVSPELSDDGEESGALTIPEYLSQELKHIHDDYKILGKVLEKSNHQLWPLFAGTKPDSLWWWVHHHRFSHNLWWWVHHHEKGRTKWRGQ